MAEELAQLLVISELIDSDNEKEARGKTSKWVKRRETHSFTHEDLESILRYNGK